MDSVPAQNTQQDNNGVNTISPISIPSISEGMAVHTIAPAEQAPAYEAPKVETQVEAQVEAQTPEVLPTPEAPKPTPEPVVETPAQKQPDSIQTIVAVPEEVPNVVDLTGNPLTLKNVAENADAFTEELDKEEGEFIDNVEKHFKKDD